MANTIYIKHGEGEPTSTNLKEYELGFSDTTKKIYINNGEEVQPISLVKKTWLSLSATGGTISGLSLTDYCSVFIDLDFSNTALNDNQIKAFRKADLVYDNYSGTTLNLKIKGKTPTQSFLIPIQITVVY